MTTIVAEVNNASLLPLADDMTVKVGLYNSPVVDENATSYAEATVKASDLYDADAKQNKVKIVTLTLNRPEFNQVLYLRTTPMQGAETLKDVRPSNNVLPVYLMGKDDHAVATHLDNVQVADDNTLIYNTSGVRQNSMSKGVNIVVKGGQARKVIQGKYLNTDKVKGRRWYGEPPHPSHLIPSFRGERVRRSTPALPA